MIKEDYSSKIFKFQIIKYLREIKDLLNEIYYFHEFNSRMKADDYFYYKKIKDLSVSELKKISQNIIELTLNQLNLTPEDEKTHELFSSAVSINYFQSNKEDLKPKQMINLRIKNLINELKLNKDDKEESTEIIKFSKNLLFIVDLIDQIYKNEN